MMECRSYLGSGSVLAICFRQNNAAKSRSLRRSWGLCPDTIEWPTDQYRLAEAGY